MSFSSSKTKRSSVFRPFKTLLLIGLCFLSGFLSCGGSGGVGAGGGGGGGGGGNNPPNLEKEWVFIAPSQDGGSWVEQSSVTFDSQGNAFITGYFTGKLVFGSQSFQTPSGTSLALFLAKIDPNGVLQWAKGFGNGNNQYTHRVTTDKDGNVFITGSFDGTVDFGAGPLTSTGSEDIFLAKFGPDGSCHWSKRFGEGIFWQAGRGIFIDLSGNILLTGAFTGTVDFGAGPLTSTGSEDIFLVKFDPNGQALWSNRFGDASSPQRGVDVATDQFGNIFMMGSFSGTVDFGGETLSNPSTFLTNAFLAKFGPNGEHLWSKGYGDASNTNNTGPYSLRVDPSGNILFAGSFVGDVDFGKGLLTSGPFTVIFLTKLDSNGQTLWSKRFSDGEGLNSAEAYSVTSDLSGNIFITGVFRGEIQFGPNTNLSGLGYNENIFVAKFASDGSHLWSKKLGQGKGTGIAANAAGSAAVTGYFYDLDLNQDGLGSFEGFGQDLFLIRLRD